MGRVLHQHHLSILGVKGHFGSLGLDELHKLGGVLVFLPVFLYDQKNLLTNCIYFLSSNVVQRTWKVVIAINEDVFRRSRGAVQNRKPPATVRLVDAHLRWQKPQLVQDAMIIRRNIFNSFKK